MHGYRDEPGRIDVFLRAAVPTAARDRQEEVLARLGRLRTEGRIAFDVHTWERRVRRDRSDAASMTALRTFDEFAAWARDNGVGLVPFFMAREHDAWFDEQAYDELVLPIVCLAVYGGDQLRAVYPHTGADRSYSVDDLLTALEHGWPAPGLPAREIAPVR